MYGAPLCAQVHQGRWADSTHRSSRVEPKDAYIDFTSSYLGDDGAFATLGVVYLNEGNDAFPLIAIDATSLHGCQATLVHDLTHHSLRDARLPQWVEKGFTQMMEQRIANDHKLMFDREMIARQRDCLSRRDIEQFLDGSAFLSPEDDTHELAYHLAQWIVRRELDRRPTEFFRFARACREHDCADQCKHVLDETPREIVLHVIGLES